MKDAIAFILVCMFVAAVWGILKPYRGLCRRHFVGLSFILFITILSVDPNPAAAPNPTAERGPPANTGVDQGTTPEIANKAKPALDAMIPYTQTDNAKTYALVGASTFPRLNELEMGAIYAVAESTKCDVVVSGAVSLDKSGKDAPVWFVDCSNGNRFLIDDKAAASALERSSANKLAANELSESCTTTSLTLCNASIAQKKARETEVVSFCDIMVQNALVGDSSMDWEWNYAFDKGHNIQVVRGFKAENAFGAKLKHRYFCTFDASTQTIKKLLIEGPLGNKKLI